ncbi:WD repeat, SAM and U-box domain-containing protein 1-like isoform X2 [Phlebotomus argentipes]|uniref:WD repeat, SAM and U-box domain-containing protein 1-like isoform X2 n=1 Tax=Phlebotomus argentipes TaxID=94469 RepID=UPI0028933127|nr:WD repeat, SAM and U-box domain-containing protein 1-like isoform X2 [Phlebotomus argentipes]
MSNLVGNVKVLQELKAHTSDVTSIEFHGSSILITGSSDKTVRVFRWQVGSGFVEESFSPLIGHKYGVTSVRMSPQGGVLASSSVDGSIILWNIGNGQKVSVLNQEAGEAIRACAFRPDGSVIVSSDDSGGVCMWGQSKNFISSIRVHEEAVHTLAFSQDSYLLLTGCNLGNLRFFILEATVESQKFIADCSVDNAHDLGVLSADFCKIVRTDPSDPRTSIYTLVTCGSDHYLRIWRLFVVRGKHEDEERRTRLIPQTPQEHICGSATIYCTERMNAECVQSINAHGSSVTCVRFNESGTLLVSSSLDRMVKIWDMQGNCLKTLSDHTRYVNCITINGNSTIIASGSNDRRVLIWDLAGNLTLNSHISEMRSLLLSLVAQSGTDIPLDYICPITHELMKNPVILEDGFSYEAAAIEEWFKMDKNTSPMTNLELTSTETIPNTQLRGKIEKYLKSLDFDAVDTGF